MANRYTLHKNSLEDFQKWLVADGWEIEKSKGIFEVLRARKAGRPQPLIVYTKTDAKEHLTVMSRDVGVVRAFLRAKKKLQTNADRIRSMTDEEPVSFILANPRKRKLYENDNTFGITDQGQLVFCIEIGEEKDMDAEMVVACEEGEKTANDLEGQMDISDFPEVLP